MTVVYLWSGGSGPQNLDERVSIEPNGALLLWRTVCGGRVGQFSLALGAQVGAEVAALAAEAASGEPVGGRFHPGQAEETVTIGDGVGGEIEDEDSAVMVTVAGGDQPGGPWGALLDRCRSHLHPSEAEPVAGVAISGDATRLHLEHIGTEPFELCGPCVSVSVTSVDERMTGIASSSVDVTIDATATARVGWHLDLDVRHGLTPPAGGSLVAACLMQALVGGYPKQIAVSLPT